MHWLLFIQEITSIKSTIAKQILYTNLHTIRLTPVKSVTSLFGLNSVKAAVRGPMLILNHKASLIRFWCFQLCLLHKFNKILIFWKLSSVLKNHALFFDMQLSQKIHPGLIINVVRLSVSSYFALGQVNLHKHLSHWTRLLIWSLTKWQNQLFSVPVETEKDQTSSTCTF